jgi:Ca-activated chloride channel family protein
VGIHFQYKFFAWLFSAIGILVLLYFYWLSWKKHVKKKMGDTRMIDQLISYYSANKFMVKFFLIGIAFAMGILAVMNPRKPGASDSSTRKGIDIAIALDVSKSMLATDMAPNRLERAKQLINKLMDAMPDDRIALVLFAGKAYMQMPLTADHGAASLFVSSASPDAVPQQGTVITDALDMSSRVFNSAEKRFKTIVLISDGEDHDPGAIAKATELSQQGVMINTVGIGSLEGSTIVDPATGELKKDETGNIVVSRLNEEELRNLSNKTNGVYVHLETTEAAVRTLQGQLSQIDRKAYGDISMMNFTSYYPWLAMAMLLFLLIESLITENRRIMEAEKKLAA